MICAERMLNWTASWLRSTNSFKFERFLTRMGFTIWHDKGELNPEDLVEVARCFFEAAGETLTKDEAEFLRTKGIEELDEKGSTSVKHEKSSFVATREDSGTHMSGDVKEKTISQVMPAFEKACDATVADLIVYY